MGVLKEGEEEQEQTQRGLPCPSARSINRLINSSGKCVVPLSQMQLRWNQDDHLDPRTSVRRLSPAQGRVSLLSEQL